LEHKHLPSEIERFLNNSKIWSAEILVASISTFL
jgi:hypothetical protein